MVLREALVDCPYDADVLCHLQVVLECMGGHCEATNASISLGMALEADDRQEEAVEAYSRGLKDNPQCLRALTCLGRAYVGLGDAVNAVRRFREVLAKDQDNLLAHTLLGRALHLAGSFDAGLVEFRWFAYPRAMRWRAFEQPLWDGSPIEGRTIFLWADQALGDTIQFLPSVHFLRLKGARVLLECPSRLLPLVSPLIASTDLVVQGAPLPGFDVHAPLTLIPSTLGRWSWGEPETGAYLAADNALVHIWRRRLDEGRHAGTTRTVGISWAGHPEGTAGRARFMRLSMLAPLGEVPGVRFVSLQMGPQAAEAKPAELCVDHLQSESSTIADTAALMRNLDLVITVDTMIAHLAGALALPVWTLLPYAADWRWLTNTDGCPWYPTMRLFRQTRKGDWQGVIERVRDALALHTVKPRSSASRWPLHSTVLPS